MIYIVAKQKTVIHIHVSCDNSADAAQMADALESTKQVKVLSLLFVKEAGSSIFICERLPGYNSEEIIELIREQTTVRPIAL